MRLVGLGWFESMVLMSYCLYFSGVFLDMSSFQNEKFKILHLCKKLLKTFRVAKALDNITNVKLGYKKNILAQKPKVDWPPFTAVICKEGTTSYMYIGRYQDISGPGHLGTEHMRHLGTGHLGTRFWTSRY